jgi:hypothetical protein
MLIQVLFRNNFAISRDIADLFQSFQASSAILDPTANPSLFQSTLVIIIKVRLYKLVDTYTYSVVHSLGAF